METLETLKQKETRLEEYFVKREDELVKKEQSFEKLVDEVKYTFADLEKTCKMVVDSAKTIKNIIASEYVIVESKEEGDSFLFYSQTHVIFCERILNLVNELKNNFNLDNYDLD